MRFVTQAFSGTNVKHIEQYISRVTERIDYHKQILYAWVNQIHRYKLPVGETSEITTLKVVKRRCTELGSNQISLCLIGLNQILAIFKPSEAKT